ncbi:SDR family NAD(P)-dependent oxidoreductase [Arthrobacter mangrovi]|uniref:Gluconate 5-dehydrogenase n=1 Tax=Arthrobacter mangrovi TaxID=2966350 RepID=A0ABQ5MRE2_9MICC|nr:SDR family oxidoreductase [Arthrobacter mangrovi]GLB66547.1 gluconate 5-dehydrogenase [Arthrobacter mangrovi]
MENWLGLADRRVLVAGGGGIGTACAAAFTAAGARVAVADRDPARLAGQEHPLVTDFSTTAGCDDAVARAAGALGGLDILVHAVGVNQRVPVLDTSDDDWDRIVGINLSSVFRLGRAAGRHMVDAGWGRQVYCSSVSGLLAHPEHGPYAASKGGINQLLRVMAREWAPRGVTVNAIAPGYTETDLTRTHLDKPGVREHYTSLVPAGRLGSVDDLTGPVLFLASDQAAFVTGHVMYVDGGRTLV